MVLFGIRSPLILEVEETLARLSIEVEAAVSMLAHSSQFVPLAKWPMLITGNCRCVTADGMQTIAEAVLSSTGEGEAIYHAVGELVLSLGAPAERLVRPSSSARAISNGVPLIERIDLLVLQLMRQGKLDTSSIEPIMEVIEQRLARNSQLVASP